MVRRFVVVNDQIDSGMFCIDICDNYYTALGMVMANILDFKEDYKDDGDEFEVTDPIQLEGDGGEFIEVTFKAKNWKKAGKERWYILYLDRNVSEE